MGNFVSRWDFITKAVSVNPAVDTELENSALYIGGAGDVEVVLQGQTTSSIFAGIPAGTFLPIVCIEVKAAGTTASSILAVN